jgi:hypothetical protein
MSEKIARFNEEKTPAKPPYYWADLLTADHLPRMSLWSVSFREIAFYEGAQFLPYCSELSTVSPTDFGSGFSGGKCTDLLKGFDRGPELSDPSFAVETLRHYKRKRLIPSPQQIEKMTDGLQAPHDETTTRELNRLLAWFRKAWAAGGHQARSTKG